MDNVEIRDYIMSYLNSSWATCTSVAWPNREFNKDAAINANAYWIEPTIKMAPTSIGELGEEGVGIRHGVLMIGIFGPPGYGTREMLVLSKRLETMWKRTTQANECLIFDDPSTIDDGINPDNYYQMMMSVNFQCFDD